MKETDYGTKTDLQVASNNSAKVAKTEFVKKIDDWWKMVFDTAFELCPKDTWTLATSLHIVEGVPDVSAFFGVAAGPQGNSPADYDVINKSIVAGGEQYINPKTGKGCTYAEAVHDGHLTRGGGWVEGTYFLSDAIEMGTPILDKLLEETYQAIATEWSKGSRPKPE